jgi:hypothetical protein
MSTGIKRLAYNLTIRNLAKSFPDEVLFVLHDRFLVSPLFHNVGYHGVQTFRNKLLCKFLVYIHSRVFSEEDQLRVSPSWCCNHIFKRT